MSEALPPSEASEAPRVSADAGQLTVRPFEGRSELEACYELQRRIWGEEFVDGAPPAVLKIAQEVGGVSAGAFDPDGRLRGFVFGISGFRDGRPAHWSHMLGVDPDSRGLGVGSRLKEYQRETLLELGVPTVFWTFDPLVARNGRLNLHRLGCRIEGYERDYYGEGGGGSRLARGIGTDRFVVRWEIEGERVARALAGEPPGPGDEAARAAPVVNARPGGDGAPVPLTGEELEERLRRVPGRAGDAPAVRVAVPADVHAVREEAPERAAWRASTRRAIEELLGRGYRVETVARDDTGGGPPQFAYYLVPGLDRGPNRGPDRGLDRGPDRREER